MATEKTLLTADDLFRMPDDHMWHELVRGELRTMAPPGAEHGWLSVEVATALQNFVKPRRLGWVLSETGFHIFQDPDTVRAPDAAFVAAHRFPEGRLPQNFPRLAPDLVVEVLSPGDTRREIEEKVADWLEAGVRLVWVVRPSARTLAVHAPGAASVVLTPDDVLDGAEVLPGFSYNVRDLFGD